MKKLGLLVLAVLMISLSSCGGDNAEKAKDTANEAVEATQNAAENAAEKVGEAAEKVGEAAKETAEKAVDAAKEATGGADGKALFDKNNCASCHNMDKETVGPAVKAIGAGYAGKKDAMVKFFKGEADPIIDPKKFDMMKPQITTITKKMSDDELSALADFFLNAK